MQYWMSHNLSWLHPYKKKMTIRFKNYILLWFFFFFWLLPNEIKELKGVILNYKSVAKKIWTPLTLVPWPQWASMFVNFVQSMFKPQPYLVCQMTRIFKAYLVRQSGLFSTVISCSKISRPCNCNKPSYTCLWCICDPSPWLAWSTCRKLCLRFLV